MAKPTSTIASRDAAADDDSAQSIANQNVRICQAKCDSSQVPRASPRFT